jgi:hypothetical protein
MSYVGGFPLLPPHPARMAIIPTVTSHPNSPLITPDDFIDFLLFTTRL